MAATLKSIDYNVAMTFILNNNNNNQDFNGAPLIDVEYHVREGTRQRHRYHGILIGNYTHSILNSVNSSDLE